MSTVRLSVWIGTLAGTLLWVGCASNKVERPEEAVPFPGSETVVSLSPSPDAGRVVPATRHPSSREPEFAAEPVEATPAVWTAESPTGKAPASNIESSLAVSGHASSYPLQAEIAPQDVEVSALHDLPDRPTVTAIAERSPVHATPVESLRVGESARGSLLSRSESPTRLESTVSTDTPRKDTSSGARDISMVLAGFALLLVSWKAVQSRRVTRAFAFAGAAAVCLLVAIAPTASTANSTGSPQHPTYTTGSSRTSTHANSSRERAERIATNPLSSTSRATTSSSSVLPAESTSFGPAPTTTRVTSSTLDKTPSRTVFPRPLPPPRLTPVEENGSYYGQLNEHGRPKTMRVRGYYRKDGTYVRGHYRSRPSR